jgi:hypothetical protein
MHINSNITLTHVKFLHEVVTHKTCCAGYKDGSGFQADILAMCYI